MKFAKFWVFWALLNSCAFLKFDIMSIAIIKIKER